MSSEYFYKPLKDEYYLSDGTKASGKKVAALLKSNFSSDAEVVRAIRKVEAATIAADQSLSIAQNRTAYQYDGADKSLLESFPNPMTGPGYGDVEITVPEFTSLCPMTGQPDFATIKIKYRPRKKCVESKALKLYLGSFRQHGEFHEACVQRISRDLIELLDPRNLSVIGEFTPRGGIPFWPKMYYTRPVYILEFLKAPGTSLEGLNTFRKGDKWANIVGDIEDSKLEYFSGEHVGLVYEGKYVGTADITKADYGVFSSMLTKHRAMNFEPDELDKSLERAYGHIESTDAMTVLYLGNVKLFAGDG
jgi:7-cyano-7-deazaguanine reductase